MYSKFRRWLFDMFGIDWWEHLGLCSDPGMCGSHTLEIRRSRFTGEMWHLYWAGGVGCDPQWMPVDEEMKREVEEAV